jgi:hypothetical protein
MKVAMLLHVRAKPRGAAIHGHLTRHPERTSASGSCKLWPEISGSSRFGANKDFFRRRMILLQQHIVHVPPLRGEPESAGAQPFQQMAIPFFLLDRSHAGLKLNRLRAACQYLE